MSEISSVSSATTSEGALLAPLSASATAEIVEALRDLRFGQVTVVVQDGRIVQIDRLEKRRLAGAGAAPMSNDARL